MTPDRLRNYLDALAWSTTNLAERAAVSPVTARRWRSGRVPIPDEVARVIEQMAALAATLARKLAKASPQELPKAIPQEPG
jgi:ribosome-binding protein aMBF1 (putative translation factor)